MRFVIAATMASAILSGCASSAFVRQSDLDAWVNVPAAALDSHTVFAAMHLTRRIGQNGVETRIYRNAASSASCSSNTYGTGKNTFTTTDCNDGPVCNNVFVLKDGVVMQYQPTGACYTNERLRPEPGWERFAAQSKVQQDSRRRWRDAIDGFIAAEAARQGGMNYRSEPAKMALLDKYVKLLANDSANEDKPMIWFLMEADRKVRAETEKQKL